jgi:hypothetical protein
MQSARGAWKVTDDGIAGTVRGEAPRFSREITGSKKMRTLVLVPSAERRT